MATCRQSIVSSMPVPFSMGAHGQGVRAADGDDRFGGCLPDLLRAVADLAAALVALMTDPDVLAGMSNDCGRVTRTFCDSARLGACLRFPCPRKPLIHHRKASRMIDNESADATSTTMCMAVYAARDGTGLSGSDRRWRCAIPLSASCTEYLIVRHARDDGTAVAALESDVSAHRSPRCTTMRRPVRVALDAARELGSDPHVSMPAALSAHLRTAREAFGVWPRRCVWDRLLMDLPIDQCANGIQAPIVEAIIQAEKQRELWAINERQRRPGAASCWSRPSRVMRRSRKRPSYTRKGIHSTWDSCR